jgi:hypothetical protein
VYALLVLFVLSPGLLAEDAANLESRLVIPDGTAVRLRLTQTVSSLHARVGDPLEFVVENDVTVKGRTVIAAKSRAQGTVVGVKGKRCLGIGGEVAYKVDSVEMANGEKVTLQGQGKVKGSYRIWRMVTGMAVTAAFYLPAAPVFLLTRGGNGTLLKGTEITAHIAGEASVLPADAPQIGESAPGLNGLMENMAPRVLDGDGREGDMVNLIFVGQKEELEGAFARAGWVKTDPWRPIMAWHLLLHIRQDAKLPLSRFYMFGRQQDYSYALPDPEAQAVRRHHIRIWKTGYTADGETIWTGAATHDVAVTFKLRGRIFNHKIDPHVDTERDFVGKNLADTVPLRQQYLHPENPVFAAETASGDAYQSDSRILMLDFHQPGDTTAAVAGPTSGTAATMAKVGASGTPVLQSRLK